MKKIAISAFLGLAIAAGVAVAQSPTFNITAPADGVLIRRGNSVTVQWTHSAYYDTHPAQHGIPYAKSTGGGSPIAQIANPVPIVSGQFVWAAGQKSDGTWLPPGTYEITIESQEYNDSTGPNVTIFLLDFKREFLRRKIELPKIPDLPQGYFFDPRAIELEMEGLESVRIELAQNGKRLADLGRFGRGMFGSGPAKIQLDPRSIQNPTGFELLVYSASGKMLLKQAIDVALAGK
ncbi:MAG: hypothetical protein NTZ26_09720 [Candidatus Aminicenantes bacterium]|nr:hypothetical protein [Candidatus Aminicenantes bacterium]